MLPISETTLSDSPTLLPRLPRWRNLALLILIAAPFGFGALTLFLGQDANWDLRNYHWYNAWAFLTHRGVVDMLAAQTPWFYNPAIDLPFYWLATHAPAKAAGFALGWVQGLNVVLLFMLAHVSLRIANPQQKLAACFILALTGMLGGGGIALIGTTFYDNVTSLGFFLSALLVLRYEKRLADLPAGTACLLALAFGIPSGLMMGLKLPGVIFASGFCFALLGLPLPLPRRLALAFGFGCGILLGLAISFGFWGWHLQSTYGNPFFPYFNQVFHSKLAPPSSARDTEYITRSLHDFILFPFLIAASPFRAGEIDFRDWALPILYALIPLAVVLRLVFGRGKPQADAVATQEATRYLLWAATVSYFVWLLMFCIYRYAVPLEMLAPLLIVLAAGLLPLRAGPRALLTGCVLLALVVSVQPGNWSRRADWLPRFVEVQLPPLPDLSHTLILMAGMDPYSHLLPEFPPTAGFVRLSSNFIVPGQPAGFNALIRARVTGHHGPFMLLIPSWRHQEATDALSAYGLSAQWRACQTVTDRLYVDQLYDLCPVN